MTEKKKIGRPRTGNVKLTCWIKPENKQKLGKHPGKVLDRVLESIEIPVES